MVGPTGLAIAAMVMTAGVLLVIAGFRGALPSPSATRGGGSTIDHLILRLVLGAAGLIGVFLVTGWPVAAGFFGAGGFLLPTLTVAKRERRAAIERVEAIATWAEGLRDTMAASAGIQEALRLSAKVAPAPIRTEVNDLTLRLQHESTTSALRRFAADMDHPLADVIVASLIMASSRHGGSLHNVLAMAAKNARDQASMWRQVEGGRAQVYAQARMAGWISFIVISFFVLARREFLEPFDSPAGQAALFFVCGAFFFSGVAIQRLGRAQVPRRMFQGIERWSDPATAEPGGGR